MKIDLHLHTPLSKKNGDVIIWTSTLATLKTLIANKIRIAAFTDHNAFDLNLYLEAKKLLQTSNMILLPGVELNVVRKNGIIANLLILFPEDLTIEQLQILNTKINKLVKSGIPLSKANDFLSEFETIRIPHIGKEDYFASEDLQDLNYDAFEVTNEKHRNYLDVLKNGYTSSIVAFSDTHKWNSYPQINNLITVIDMEYPSFKNLKKALKENKNYTKKG